MRTTALLYHDIVAMRRYGESGYGESGFQGADADIYKLDCAEFSRHLKAIASHPGLKPDVVTEAGFGRESRQLLLTFDDGGVGAVLHAAGMLQEYGWPGHFFITTDRIGTPGFLDETQLRTLHRLKHVIGSHSCSHPARMAACPASQLDREWRDSVRRLEDILGQRVTTASVPGGYYSRAVASAAAAAGVGILFNSEPVTRVGTVDGCRIVGRFCVQQGVSAEWVSSVVADRALPRAQRFLAWNGKKLLKVVGGSAWLAMRKKILDARAAIDKRRCAPYDS